MATYNALTVNDSFGVSPRSHFVTADGRDLDLRYLMLKNLPEKLKAMGVLFGAGSDISIAADGKIYYADGVSIVDGDSGQVLVTKTYVDNRMTGNYEPKGAVQNHVDSTDHLIIGFSSSGNYGIDFEPDQCATMFSSSSVAKLKAASLFHHHDSRYAKLNHTHTEIASTIKTVVDEYFDKAVSIEVVPETISKRDQYGILKATDPYTMYPDEAEETVETEQSSVSTQKGPPMDSVVTALSLRRRLQPKFIRCKLTSKPFVPSYDPSDAGQHEGDGSDPDRNYSSNVNWGDIRNLKQLLEYLHPGLHLDLLPDVNDTRIFWGTTNLNQTQIYDWIKEAYLDNNLKDLPSKFFLMDSYDDEINSRIHSSTVKFDLSNIAVPLIDFRRELILDPPDLNIYSEHMEISYQTSMTDNEGFYFWFALPDSAFISDNAEFLLKCVENDFSVTDNWNCDGYVKNADKAWTEEDPTDTRGLCKVKDTYGNLYTIYVSNFRYTGSLYRFALNRKS